MSQHFAGGALNRIEVSMLLADQGVQLLEPVYWRFPDGSVRLAALVQEGEGAVTALALDLGLCEDEVTPPVHKLVHQKVMDRVADIMAEGFRLGYEAAMSGNIPGVETTTESEHVNG